MERLDDLASDCSFCDCAQSLRVVQRNELGQRVVECSCCSKVYVLDEHGAVVHQVTRDPV